MDAPGKRLRVDQPVPVNEHIPAEYAERLQQLSPDEFRRQYGCEWPDDDDDEVVAIESDEPVPVAGAEPLHILPGDIVSAELTPDEVSEHERNRLAAIQLGREQLRERKRAKGLPIPQWLLDEERERRGE